jgi:HlyD family secretion protein
MLKRILLALLIGVLILFAIFKLPSYLQPKRQGHLMVSGRVEADEVRLSSEIGGRLKEVYISEGMKVRKGDVVAVIDDEILQSKKRELLHTIEELEERTASAEINIRYLKSETSHKIEEAENALSVARARLRQADVRRLRAEREYRRYSNLFEKGAVSRDEFESVELAYRLSIEEYNTALEGVKTAEVSLKRARSSEDVINAKVRELRSMERSLDVIRERLRQIEINIGYTKVKAPSDGVILRRIAEPGEIVPSGGVIGILIKPEDVYVKTFVPERYIGMISLDMEVEVVTDAYRDRPVHGYICYISDRSEFTPKEVQSYEERVKQVFAVKVCLKGDEEAYKILKKGMPVDVIFPVSG